MPNVVDVLPVLATTDLAATMAYIEEVLGGTDLWTWEPEGVPAYGGATFGSIPLHFIVVAEPRREMQAYVHLNDVDALRAEIAAREPECPEPEDRPYGMRDFELTLPGNVVLVFGSDVKP